ncbi:MAG: acyl-[acyl-carrier-protein]--UDP-N-acetylglucosamine O-acyltransferase, partial [Synergistaceae bacterium]|nr:acyl-[acyl-carrier-protein]--UDP-N-acetylglucosamine O-acyltransferase [Synergistaceae bacterium]
MSVHIHPTAIVSPKAQLGENVRIGPFCMVDENVILGDETELRAYVHIYNYTEMGSG